MQVHARSLARAKNTMRPRDCGYGATAHERTDRGPDSAPATSERRKNVAAAATAAATDLTIVRHAMPNAINI